MDQTTRQTGPLATVERLRTAFDKGGAHIGDLAWPELRAAGLSLERATLRAWLDEEGLPESWAPPEPSGQRAFGKALAKVRNLESAPGITVERETLRSRIALVRHSQGAGLGKRTSTWARVQVNDLDELEVEWSEEQVVGDARSGAVPNVVLSHANAAIAALQAEYETLVNYTDTAEMGEMVVEVLVHKLGAVRVRRDGGLYYVPTGDAERLRAFSRVIEKAGDSALQFIPAFDTPEGRANIGRSVNETLQGEIRAVVDGLVKLGTEARGPRKTSLERRLSALDDLRARAATCKIVLESYADDITSALKAARVEVERLLDLDLDESDESEG